MIGLVFSECDDFLPMSHGSVVWADDGEEEAEMIGEKAENSEGFVVIVFLE